VRSFQVISFHKKSQIVLVRNKLKSNKGALKRLVNCLEQFYNTGPLINISLYASKSEAYRNKRNDSNSVRCK